MSHGGRYGLCPVCGTPRAWESTERVSGSWLGQVVCSREDQHANGGLGQGVTPSGNRLPSLRLDFAEAVSHLPRNHPSDRVTVHALTARDLAEQPTPAAQELHSESEFKTALNKVAALCVSLIDGCDDAGISIVLRESIKTSAATSDMVARGHYLQNALGEGPCRDAIEQQETVYSPDLAHEARWPTWGPSVAKELKFRSMLCVPLDLEGGDARGALDVYSRSVDGFDAGDQAQGVALAAHAAVAVAAAEQVRQLNDAIATRTIIGQAQGILMERRNINQETAFELLRRMSQQRNVRLHEFAAGLVESYSQPATD